ncbi:uncharacterized protein LOC143589450 isoform X2 [Bidens hawaiensis]|uniref:uncharacterized protein LOC143589450 isoform X2 n=1 Tax=Bidens hawaiensis TaxID=980011 RepID=UPI00404ACF86
MENEKKKRNKKKKNKQAKATASAAAGGGELNNHANASKNLNSDNSDVPKTVADSDRDSISGTETSRSVEADKSYWLNREASLEQKIKELQEQLDMHAQREADHLSQSWKERNLWHHKENELEARVSQLQTEKHSWLQKENSAAATLATLNKDNAKLQARVIELETSINHISHQNQQLKEHVSDLQLKIQDLENAVATHISAERTKLESAQALVARLLSENEKLVEKVNILQIELDQKTASIQSSDPIIKIPKSADMDDTSASETDPILSSAEELDTVSNVGPLSGMPSDKLVNHMNPLGSDLNQISRVSMESVEIVQVSLNENDAMPATSVPEPVPLTDAPLIGAPFRLISFMARYVSGADLVQK